MQLKNDVKRMRRLAKRVLKGRRASAALEKLIAERPERTPGHFRVGVYFADSDVNIYQMRQWYEPLRELSRVWPVLLIARNAAGALALSRESGLEVAYTKKVTDIETLVAEQPLEVILYVNQNTRNFQMMRYGSRWHVFINHGESDKMYMKSNQHKAYDYALVAGEAAQQRLAGALWDYDVARRTIAIGRPQTDHCQGDAPYPVDDRTVVLYAPTWEGDRPAAAYGSVRSHGETLVRALLASKQHRLVYRPHPRSGVVDAEFGAANQRIVQMIAQANAQDPTAHHVFDDSGRLDWQLTRTDVAICDVSAMVYDRLATGRPLLVTRPIADAAAIDEGGYLRECEWLEASDAAEIIAAIERVQHDAVAQQRLVEWSHKYFGDTTQGAPTARFHEAIASLLARADEWRARSQR